MAKQSLTSWLQLHTVSVARLHFWYAAIFLFAVVLFDAWNLITTETIVERWMIGTAILIAAAVVWYAAKRQTKSTLYFQGLLYLLIAVDIFVATHAVYSQRGIASRAVLLYVIPILVAATLLSRPAIFTVTTVSVALYSAVCVKYFYENPGQAYKVELYGEVAFYSAILVFIAFLIWVLISSRKN